jgi:capsular exopolysaccharide synthesis family protein
VAEAFMDSGIIFRSNRGLESNPAGYGQGPIEIVESPRPQIYSSAHAFGPAEQHPLLRYWRILRKRKWTALAVFVTVLLLAIIATLRVTRLYEATSRIAIYPENSNVLGLKDLESAAASAELDYTVAMETQVSILRSDELALKVIAALQLENNPIFMGSESVLKSARAEIPRSDLAPDPRHLARMLAIFRRGLNIQVVPRTRVLEISYMHRDARLAAEISNTLVKTFIEENFRTKYESTSQTADWLSKELSDLQLKVQTSEEKLVRYEKEKGILGIDEKQNIVTAKLDELNKELTAAQTDRIQKESNYKLAQSGDPSVFAKLSPENLLERLQAEQADLENQYARATTEFGSAYPQVIELKNQLKQVQASVVAENDRLRAKVRDEYRAAEQREKLLAAALAEQKQEANQLNESAIEYTALKRDSDSNRQLYESLLQRLKEASVTAGLRSSNIRVVDVAQVPIVPAKPNVPGNIALGFLLGIVGGFALALLQENLDTTVLNLEELSAITSLPALGTIPLQIAGNNRRRLGSGAASEVTEASVPITYLRPKSEVAESYRALRTSILLSSFGAPPKVILITSALPQEGKTTVSSNSAMVLAQKGGRILLVDADMRRPGVIKALGIRSTRGLSTVLSGVDKVENSLVPFPQLPNLLILPAGPVPPNPVELLGSNVMKDYISRWRNEFDHIIIDTPPCLSVTDSVVLSVEADRVILVARSGQTPKAALRRASELLQQVNAHVMGVVLNAFNVHSADGYYNYYGSKYASHYYEQSEAENCEAHAS